MRNPETDEGIRDPARAKVGAPRRGSQNEPLQCSMVLLSFPSSPAMGEGIDKRGGYCIGEKVVSNMKQGREEGGVLDIRHVYWYRYDRSEEERKSPYLPLLFFSAIPDCGCDTI